jgi:hypothetical protein
MNHCDCCKSKNGKCNKNNLCCLCLKKQQKMKIMRILEQMYKEDLKG